MGGDAAMDINQFCALRSLGDVLLLDIVDGLPRGEAMDINQMLSERGIDSDVRGSTDYSEMKNSDIVVVVAGSPRKPGMTRMDLLKINSSIVGDVASKIKQYAPDSTIIPVTNPLDPMVYAYLKKIHGVAEEFAYMGRNVIDAFVGSDRKAAIVAISQHKQFEKRMQNLRTSLESEKNISVTYLDLLYLFERIEKAWNDIADLIKPVYVA